MINKNKSTKQYSLTGFNFNKNIPQPKIRIPNFRELSQTVEKVQETHQKVMSLKPLQNMIKGTLSASSMIDLKQLNSRGLLRSLRHDINEPHPNSQKIELKYVEKTFQILDPKNKGEKITLVELQKKLFATNPNIQMDDIQALTNGKHEIKATELHAILQDNTLENFDPMIDAFKILDPDNTGYLDYKKLHQLFGVMSYGKINALEIDLLIECLDKDGDKKISIQDLKTSIEEYDQIYNLVENQDNKN